MANAYRKLCTIFRRRQSRNGMNCQTYADRLIEFMTGKKNEASKMIATENPSIANSIWACLTNAHVFLLFIAVYF